MSEAYTKLSDVNQTMAEKLQDTLVDYPDGGFDFYGKNFKEKDGKIQLENAMRTDIIKRIGTFESVYFPVWIQAIKDYTLSTLDRAVDLKKKKMTWLTNEKQPIIRTYVDRLVQTLFGANWSLKCYALSEKNFKKTKKAQNFIERCFSSSKAKKALMDMATMAILLGPGYARTGFELCKEKLKEMTMNDEDKAKVEFNIDYPTALFEYVSEFNLFGEPFVPFYEQRNIVYRKVAPIKTILKKVEQLGGPKLDDKHLAYIIKSPKPFSYKNYDKIKLIKYFQDYALSMDNFEYDNIFQLHLDNTFCEYVEYRVDGNLALFMNGYCIYDGANPRKTKNHPFKIINFTRLPGVWISDGVGTLLAGQQRLYDALYNISFDLVKFNAGPMFLLQPGQFLETMDGRKETMLDYQPFSFKQVRGPGKIEVFEMPKPDASVSMAMTNILQMTDMTISPSNYNQISGVSRSASDAQFRYEGMKDSVQSLMESISEMLTETAQEWLIESQDKMPEKFKIMIMGKKGKQEFDKINLVDLKGKFLFEFESESIKDYNKVIDRTHFIQLLQQLGTLGQDPVTQKWLIDSQKLLAEGLDLFNIDPDMILSDEEYKNKLIESQKQAAEIQKQLAEISGGFQQQGQEGMQVAPTEQGIPGVSSYGDTSQPGGSSEGVDIASIIKMAQGS